MVDTVASRQDHQKYNIFQKCKKNMCLQNQSRDGEPYIHPILNTVRVGAVGESTWFWIKWSQRKKNLSNSRFIICFLLISTTTTTINFRHIIAAASSCSLGLLNFWLFWHCGVGLSENLKCCWSNYRCGTNRHCLQWGQASIPRLHPPHPLFWDGNIFQKVEFYLFL